MEEFKEEGRNLPPSLPFCLHASLPPCLPAFASLLHLLASLPPPSRPSVSLVLPPAMYRLLCSALGSTKRRRDSLVVVFGVTLFLILILRFCTLAWCCESPVPWCERRVRPGNRMRTQRGGGKF
ncbi:hypothetical protein E2C01_017261 [Portunus trituberculatus]|uniref:Transmembrane protein n=1 Tax=Portunus trituberculatus TaxID=210409 RepID=A0A5B7DSE2_PORTR|nr:hypothetical protein [Portunus trituberculatus]